MDDQEIVNFPLQTDEFGALNGVKGQSVRARFCTTGSYFGILPLKLANGRLRWPVKVACERRDESHV